MSRFKEKLMEVILALLILALAYLDLRYVMPFVWRQGSSSAFEFALFLFFAGLAMIGAAAWLIFYKKKGVRRVQQQ